MIYVECGGRTATAHAEPSVSTVQCGANLHVVMEAGDGRDSVTVALDLDTLLSAAVETARLGSARLGSARLGSARLGGPGVARLVSSRLLLIADHLGPPPTRANVVALR